jgi:DNA-binding NarL/FixJ family response regulator
MPLNGTKPLLLTAVRDEESIFNALKAGAKGYLSKDASSSDLVKAIKAVHQGEMWIEAKLISKFFEMEAATGFKKIDQNDTKNELTNREKEILSCLAKGMTNKQIAKALFVSDKTVKAHLNSIFKKLNVTRRYEAIIFAIQKGYV